LAITNYDEDHVSGLKNLSDKIDVQWLLRNKGVETKHLKQLKSEDGMGPGIDHLCYLIDNVYTVAGDSPRPGYLGLERQTFFHSYPTFEDENNLSLVTLLKCRGVGVLFAGDIERAGWLEMLKRPEFRDALSSVRVLVAPHHGREGGCCEDAM